MAHSSVAPLVDVDPPVRSPPPPPHGRPALGRSGHDPAPTALQAMLPYAKPLLHPSQPRTGSASSSRSFQTEPKMQNCTNVQTTLSVGSQIRRTYDSTNTGGDVRQKPDLTSYDRRKSERCPSSLSSFTAYVAMT